MKIGNSLFCVTIDRIEDEYNAVIPRSLDTGLTDDEISDQYDPSDTNQVQLDDQGAYGLRHIAGTIAPMTTLEPENIITPTKNKNTCVIRYEDMSGLSDVILCDDPGRRKF